jgi:hypothetical protein
MLIFEVSDVSSLKEFVNIPEIEWHRPINRLDNEIQMRDINGEVCH